MPKNSGKSWSKNDVSTLKKLLKGNTPTPLVAYKMGRTVDSVYSKVRNLRISAKPTNKSPYNRREK